MENRINYDAIDILKLFASHAVVAIHSSFFNGYIYPYSRLAVPFFFICTGYFAFLKIESARSISEKKIEFVRIIKRYISLYSFWFIILFPYTMRVRKYYKYDLSTRIKIFIKDLVFGSTFRASWYIMACIIGLAIVFLLSIVVNNRLLIVVTMPAYIFATACSELALVYKNIPLIDQLIQNITGITGSPYGNFIIALLYLSIGKYIASSKKEKKGLKKYILLSLISVILLALEYGVMRKSGYLIYNSDCYFSLVLAATFIFQAVHCIDRPFKYAKLLRKISTITYCTHIPVISVVSTVLDELYIIDNINGILFVSTVTICTFLSIMIINLSKIKQLKILRYAF